MQELIMQLLTPSAEMKGPTMLQRRAAEAIAQLMQRANQDTNARLRAEQLSDHHLYMANEYWRMYGPSNHQEVYREAMNEDYRLNFT